MTSPEGRSSFNDANFPVGLWSIVYIFEILRTLSQNGKCLVMVLVYVNLSLSSLMMQIALSQGRVFIIEYRQRLNWQLHECRGSATGDLPGDQCWRVGDWDCTDTPWTALVPAAGG